MSSNHAVSYQSSLGLLLALSDSALSTYEIVQPLTSFPLRAKLGYEAVFANELLLRRSLPCLRL